LSHVLLAGAATLLLFAPWLIRNAIQVGDPLFPLATGSLGRGYWSAEEQQRWANGTGPHWPAPPVPCPQGWQGSNTNPQRLKLFAENFLKDKAFSPPLLALAAVAAVVGILRRRRWPLVLAGVAAAQLLAWTAMAHEMAGRFITPILAPVALLAGTLLNVCKTGEKAGQNASESPGGNGGDKPSHNAADSRRGERGGILFACGFARWRSVVTTLMVVVLALVNTWWAYERALVIEANMTADSPRVPPLEGEQISGELEPYRMAAELPAGSRLMLLGEAKAFYFPPGTIYATVFDPHPLADLAKRDLPPAEAAKRLAEMGVTHVWVDWREVWRLANTYGFPSPLGEQVFACWRAGGPPKLPVLAGLEPVSDGGGAVGSIGEAAAWSKATFRPKAYWIPDGAPGPVWPAYTLYRVPRNR
jgi:hypothetical protein